MRSRIWTKKSEHSRQTCEKVRQPKTPLEWYRARRKSRDYFRPVDRGLRNRVFVSKHFPKGVAFFADLWVQDLSHATRAQRPKRRIYFGLAKNIMFAPSNAVKVVLQHEQTLLRPESPEGVYFQGTVPVVGTDSAWLVHLHGPFEGYQIADFVVDYSYTNIQNIASSAKLRSISKKAHYIAPLLPEYTKRKPNFELKPRVATMFGSPELGRRSEILYALRQSGLDVENCVDFEDISRALSRVEILLSLQQFSHFGTLEELRILPAIQRQVVVVVEDLPLIDRSPLRDFLVVSPEGRYIETVKTVTKNYAEIWHRFFDSPAYLETIQSLRRYNSDVFATIVNS